MSKSDQELFCISDSEIAEIESAIDMDKMRAFDKHNEDVDVMRLTQLALKSYIKRFGKESNIYEPCKELIVVLQNNIDHTEKYKDML